MNTVTLSIRHLPCLALAAVLVGVVPGAAHANHVTGFSIASSNVDMVTGTVILNVQETTTGGSTIHFGTSIDWGDTNVDFAPWTNTTGAGPKVYKVTTSHVYTDLTDRVITADADSNSSPFSDTLAVVLGCVDNADVGCFADGAGAGQYQIKDSADNAKDKLKYKWGKGAATNVDALGSPTTNTDYFLCTYGPGPVLIGQAVVPHSSKWSAAGTSGMKYKDKAGAEDGITGIKLKTGAAGKSQVQVKGGGEGLPDITIPITLPIGVQVQNSSGFCWESAFTDPAAKNADGNFLDKE